MHPFMRLDVEANLEDQLFHGSAVAAAKPEVVHVHEGKQLNALLRKDTQKSPTRLLPGGACGAQSASALSLA